MSDEEFLQKLDSMELGETLSMDTKLENLDKWDSLAVVNFGAIACMEYDVVLTSEQVNAAQTIGDLFRLIRKE